MRKSKKIASLMKMRSTLKVPCSIIKCVLAIIYSNSFSHCKVEQKKTVAISQLFSHVQLHVHGMHLLNNRIYLQYKYYITVTKTGGGTPYRSHGYVLLRFRGNVVMKMGTQQHNNQDRYVNELVPPRTWTLLGSVWCIT